VLAVPISVTVGIVVAGSEPPPQVVTSVPGPVTAEPSAGTAQMSLDAPPPTAAKPEPGFADDERAVLGTAAGLVTLSICWLILGIASMFWRYRLDQHDMRGWADGWARVEPVWSDRRR
jgi:hypothetical protein